MELDYLTKVTNLNTIVNCNPKKYFVFEIVDLSNIRNGGI